MFVGPGAVTNIGILGWLDPTSLAAGIIAINEPTKDHLIAGNVVVGAGASLNLVGGSEVEGLNATNVFLAPGSTLNLGDAPPVDGADKIDNLFNSGTLINATTGNLQLGGPGFVQVGGFEPHESEFNNGQQDFINLGNVARGSSLAPVIEDIFNGATPNTPQIWADFATWSDGGFSFSGFADNTPANPLSLSAAGSINVNTATLGHHVGLVSVEAHAGLPGYTLTVVDNVVPA